MRCLTIHQPWAHLIIHGGPIGFKRVENRSWPTRHRGRLAIHASLSKKELVNMFGGFHAKRLRPMAYGKILGSVEIYDCIRFTDLPRELRGPFASGPWCWLLRDPIALDVPVPFTGMQGLYNVPDELLLAKPTTPAGPDDAPKQQHLF